MINGMIEDMVASLEELLCCSEHGYINDAGNYYNSVEEMEKALQDLRVAKDALDAEIGS